MSVIAWRIIQRKFAKRAFRGEGARLFGGRWNSPGHAVVYTAQSLALAALEILVHVDSDKLLQDYVAIPVTVDPQLIPKSTNPHCQTTGALTQLPRQPERSVTSGSPKVFCPCCRCQARSFPRSSTSFSIHRTRNFENFASENHSASGLTGV